MKNTCKAIAITFMSLLITANTYGIWDTWGQLRTGAGRMADWTRVKGTRLLGLDRMEWQQLLIEAIEYGSVAEARILMALAPAQFEAARFLRGLIVRAADAGHMPMLQYLLAWGANPNDRTWSGTTPLHAAARNGHLDAVQFLLASGADINLVDDEGRTPLHVAVVGATPGNEHVVWALLEARAGVNIADIHGNTPLHAAAESGSNTQIVQMLLEAGADPAAVNADHMTAFELASRRGSEAANITRVLLREGADWR